MSCDAQNTVIADSLYSLAISCLGVEILMVLNVIIMVLVGVMLCSLGDKCYSF